jgi:thiol-disulfide isomerase/thioredoxin
MKKLLLIIPVLLLATVTFSQGIIFEQGTWKEVLAKAQQTNKPIFVDVFTSWCGPCKQMSSTIFPLDTVGQVFNKNFICYQIDAEKGEGIEIAKKYEVKAYPTYLFIKGDGTPIYRSLGSMPAKNFIEVSKSAMAEMNDPKPIAAWEKEYVEKKNDPRFLLDYINKRSKSGLSNTQLFDEYLKLIPEEERYSAVVGKLYLKEGPDMRVNSFAYENFLKNHKKLFMGITNTFLIDGVTNTAHDAAKIKNLQLLATAISAYDSIPKYFVTIQKDEVYMKYYAATGETDKYVKYTLDFGNNHLMKINPDSINRYDKKMFPSYENILNSGRGSLAKLDSTEKAELRSTFAHMEANKHGLSLNQIAWDVFEKTTDKIALRNALSWSKRSLEFVPDNATYLDTYANLLYKLGQKQEAITNEKEALRLTDKKDTETYKGMENTLRKMTAGEKTWK